jgi:uracil-DNA glycosylase family protein
MQTPLDAWEQEPPADLATARELAQTCTNCDLYKDATQTVFGAGPPDARLLVVGEQPGDAEDIAGLPFVGPSGRLLDEALEAAAIDRGTVYVTNAVKHFKFTQRGKRRIHDKPRANEIKACRPWLDAELAHVQPEVVLALGATAAKALLGASFKVTKQRGDVLDVAGLRVTATVHPSSVLRAPSERRAVARADFFDDVAAVGELLKRSA